KEICGFVVQLQHGPDIWQVPNVAAGSRQFKMDPGEQLAVYRHHFDQIIGVYHSHPGGLEHPSDEDETFAPVGFRYWIITSDAVVEWEFPSGSSPVQVHRTTCAT